MFVTVRRKYLRLPVGYHAAEKLLTFCLDGDPVYDLTVRLDLLEPDCAQYIDMGRFLGRTLEVFCEPQMDLSFEQADTKSAENLYREKYRPQAHFSAAFGWMNDPNGLIRHDGIYHLFFQHNPAGNRWGNMHWGHAISHDLIHWAERDEALFPDETGAMFSGSGIADRDNLAALKEGAGAPLLFFYTAAGNHLNLSAGKKFTQCLAYSTDGGETLIKYAGNPVVPHIEGDNRDPKVIFCPEINAYMMAIYLSGARFALLKSADFINWERVQTLELPGDAECPDFYPLNAGGDAARRMWVFSGASDKYLIGRMENGLFAPAQQVKPLHFGDGSYAAQTCSGVEGRTVRIAWNRTHLPDSRFNCAMCTPTEMSLREEDGQFYLCAYPIDEFASLREDIQSAENRLLSKGDELRVRLSGKAQDILLKIDLSEGNDASLSCFGLNAALLAKEDALTLGRHRMPLYSHEGKVSLRIILDTNGIEIYADKGRAFLTSGPVCDYNLPDFVLASEGARVISLAAAKLRSIW